LESEKKQESDGENGRGQWVYKKRNTTSTLGVRFHPIQKIAKLDILDGALVGVLGHSKPFITFYIEIKLEMDQIENCSIQSYGINPSIFLATY
jgi:hypothetical protein